MIRPKWPRQATLHQWRGVSSKPSSRRGRPSHHAPSGRPRPEWPQLKRRAPSRVLLDDESDEALSAELRRATPTKGDFVAKRGISRSLGRKEVDWTALTARASEIREAKEGSARGRGHGAEKSDIGAGGEAEHDVPASGSDTKNMLLVRGVSNNLNASDFYRLAPYSLSSWESSIKKGQSVQSLQQPGIYI